MLQAMSAIVDIDDAFLSPIVDKCAIDQDIAERRFEGIGADRNGTAHRNAMIRA